MDRDDKTGSLLTGKYPATVGVTDYFDWADRWHPCKGRLVDVPYIKHLPKEELNLARALSSAGYQTWHIGKWHLGGPGFHPDEQGFDVNVGGCKAGLPESGYFAPWKIPTLQEGPPGTYLTDQFTDEAIRLIRERDPKRPHFMNLRHYAVHTPIQAPELLIEKYTEKAKP